MNAQTSQSQIASVLLAALISVTSVGCTSWKMSESLPSLDPQVRREREIARRAEADPFPSAGKSTKKPL